MYLLINPQTDTLNTLYDYNENFHPGDSGLDLYCPETITVNPGETVSINLQIRCEAFDVIDNNIRKNISYYLYPRSSLVKTPLRLANSVGIIDAGYRGNICAVVDNIKNEPYIIEQGQRLFQLCSPNLEPIEYVITDTLSNTCRGSNGFGSTGK